MKLFIFLLLTIVSYAALAQPAKKMDTSWKRQYRETATRINDLVHTKLDAKFDFSKSYMYGKVWITLQPHFYPTDSLRLDAKGMEIHKIAIVKNASLRVAGKAFGDARPDGQGINELQFIDTWNHAGEYENAFFTAPFQNTLLSGNVTRVKVKAPKRVTHIFKVKAPLLQKNEVRVRSTHVHGFWVKRSRISDAGWLTNSA